MRRAPVADPATPVSDPRLQLAAWDTLGDQHEPLGRLRTQLASRAQEHRAGSRISACLRRSPIACSGSRIRRACRCPTPTYPASATMDVARAPVATAVSSASSTSPCGDRHMKPVASARNFISGKLDYIDDANLEEWTDHQTQGAPGRRLAARLRSSHRTETPSRPRTRRQRSLVQWIIDEIRHGEDVELRIGWDGGGGHMIDIIGGGEILGVPWISWVHDANQGANGNGTPGDTSDDTTRINGGTNWFDGGVGWSPIVDNRIVAYIGGEFLPGTIDFAASESIPEPGTLALLTLSIRRTGGRKSTAGAQATEVACAASPGVNAARAQSRWKALHETGAVDQLGRVEAVRRYQSPAGRHRPRARVPSPPPRQRSATIPRKACAARPAARRRPDRRLRFPARRYRRAGSLSP
jgi:hypothetical protein